MSRFAFLERHGRLVVWGMVAAYVAVFFPVCANKFRYYLYTDFDLALFTQAAHQILRGSLWNSIRGMPWIGDHSSLVLFLVAPLQAVWPGPLSLLFVQTVSLAVGAVAAWRLARHEGLPEPAPVLLAALYLLHPAIGYTNLFEFHPEVLSTSALLFAFLALRTGARLQLLLWSALALLGKEDVALPVFMMGLYALTLRRPRARGDAALLVGLAVLSLVVSFAWLKPAFNQGDVDYGDMYRHLGRTTGERALHLLLQPAEILAALVSAPGDPAGSAIKWSYYLHLLGPVLFLPLLGPLALLIAGPTVAEHMLSNRSPQHSIVFQYTASVTPFVIAATVLGVKQCAAWMAARPPVRLAAPWVAAVAVAVAIACQFAFGPFGAGHDRLPVRPFEATRPDATARALRPIRERMLARIPKEGGVVASFLFMPRLATRAEVHSAHHVLRGTFTYSRRPFPIPSGVVAFLADMGHPTLLSFEVPSSAERVQELFAKNGLRPADASGDQVLFLKDARDTVELLTLHAPEPSVPRSWTMDRELRSAGFDSVRATVAAGDEIRFFTHWRRTGEARKLYFMDVMLFDAGGVIRARHRRPIGYGVVPTASWPLGEPVREAGRWLLPPDTPSGEYALAMALSWRDEKFMEADPPQSAADPRVVPIGLVTVTAPSSPPRARE